MAALPAYRLPFTAADYFAWEVEQVERHEYFHGEVFAMSGGTARRALLGARVLRQLGNALDSTPCEVYSSDLRVEVDAGAHYVYPDATVVCGPHQFATDAETTLTNPTLVVEVLSASTEAYDRGGKFRAYRSIESLRAYVIVEQASAAVDVFQRSDDGTWTLTDATPERPMLGIDTLGVTLDVNALYDGVAFPENDEERPGEDASEASEAAG
ncbi:MAG: Uma2 family endonuclease [Bacteroidota bacterium]